MNMNVNKFSSEESLSSSQEFSPSSPVINQEERVHSLGTEVLDEPKDVSSSELSSKLIVPTPVVKKGFVERMKTFFKRRSTPTLEEQEQANKIIGAKQKLERQVDKIDAYARKMQAEEKRLKGFPSSDSLGKAATGQAELNKLLASAQSMLDDLESQETTMKGLADAYAWYEHVPAQIESIKEHVTYLQGRAKVSQALIMLERSLVAYGKPEQQPFAQFSSILENKNRLVIVLKEVIGQNSALIEDPEIQKFFKANDLSVQAVYEMISITYPGLKSQVERLFDAISSAKDQRIDLLKAKTTALEHLVTQYSKKANEINELERRLYHPTTMDGIKHPFTKPKDLKKQINRAEKEFKEIYDVLFAKGHFDLQENAWVKELGNKDIAYQALSKNIEAIQQPLSLIEERQQISDETSQILNEFKTYEKEARTIRKKLNPKLEATQLRIQAQRTFKQEIASRFQKLASTMRLVEKKQTGREIPAESLNGFESLTQLVVTNFPKLENRFKKIAQLIENHSFQTEVASSIQQREVPASETPKPTTTISVLTPPSPPPSTIVTISIGEGRRPLPKTPLQGETRNGNMVAVLPPIPRFNPSNRTRIANHLTRITSAPHLGPKKEPQPKVIETQSAPTSPVSDRREEDVSVIPAVINRLNSAFGTQEEKTIERGPPPPLPLRPNPASTQEIPQLPPVPEQEASTSPSAPEQETSQPIPSDSTHSIPIPPPPPPIVQHTKQSKIKVEAKPKVETTPEPETDFRTLMEKQIKERRTKLNEDEKGETQTENAEETDPAWD